MSWFAWALSFSGGKSAVPQTHTSLTVVFTLCTTVVPLGFRPQHRLGRHLSQAPRKCVCWTQPLAARMPIAQAVSLTSVHIGKIIPKSHSVNHAASNLALFSFELGESLVKIEIPCGLFGGWVNALLFRGTGFLTGWKPNGCAVLTLRSELSCSQTMGSNPTPPNRRQVRTASRLRSHEGDY